MALEIFQHMDGGENYVPGTTIFNQGDEPGGVMYVIQEGEVDILLNGNLIDTIGPGAFLGEIGLVDHKPRSATAVAKTACRLLPINQKRFTWLVQQTPYFALQVMQTITERLRDYRGC